MKSLQTPKSLQISICMILLLHATRGRADESLILETTFESQSQKRFESFCHKFCVASGLPKHADNNCSTSVFYSDAKRLGVCWIGKSTGSTLGNVELAIYQSFRRANIPETDPRIASEFQTLKTQDVLIWKNFPEYPSGKFADILAESEVELR